LIKATKEFDMENRYDLQVPGVATCDESVWNILWDILLERQLASGPFHVAIRLAARGGAR